MLHCTDVVNRVRNGESIPFRPQLPESTDLGKPMLDIIRNCWNESPEGRPTFQQIRTSLRKMTNGEYEIFAAIHAHQLWSISDENIHNWIIICIVVKINPALIQPTDSGECWSILKFYKMLFSFDWHFTIAVGCSNEKISNSLWCCSYCINFRMDSTLWCDVYSFLVTK
jgi:hypothetical protein